MKSVAAFPLVALALAACNPYYNTGPEPYAQGSANYPPPDYPPYGDTAYPQSGPPMPPGGPVYPGPGQPSYQQPSYQPSETTYRAIGTEPFWDLEIGRDLIFTDRGSNVSVTQPTPPPTPGTAGTTYRTNRLEVNVVHRQCNDGMSNRSYPDTVDVRVDGRQRYRGCGAPIEYFTEVDEAGQSTTSPSNYPPQYSYPPQQGYPQPAYPQPAYPQPGYPQPGYPPPNYPVGQPGQPYAGSAAPPPGPPVLNLSGTNWRVFAINGIRTPTSGFYMNFMPGQLGAKFGCNSVGGSYAQTGNNVRFGSVMATQMACADMTFENQGMRILGQPVTVSGLGESITLANNLGTIQLVRSR